MDTKLKKFSYAAAWVLLIMSTVAAAVSASAAVVLLELRRWNVGDGIGYYDGDQWVKYDSPWTGVLDDAASFEKLQFYGFAAIIACVIVAALLVFFMIMTGRFGRRADGSIRLNWFDRIWTEVHLIAAATFGTFFGFCMIPLYELGYCQDWFGIFIPSYVDNAFFDIPNNLTVAGCILAMTACAVITWSSVIAVVKKMKARMFWERSLVGGIWLAVWRGVRGSDRTTIKVILYLLILCAVEGWCGMMAFAYGYGGDGWWIVLGILFAVLWVVLIVPKKLREFNAIRKGAAEIRKGNLGYKIKIEPGRSGRTDEFGRLAADINHIGEAQSLAVQSELKNQRMKTDLISNVSHDLKTPLTSMVSYIDLLKTEGLDSENAPEYLAIIDEKTQRLKALTENLFEAAKASSGAIPVNMEVIDMASLLSQSLGEMDEKLQEKNLEVIIRNECAENMDEEGNIIYNTKVMADGQLLWRVIENLLGNVSKYALESSRVYVNLSQQTVNAKDYILLEMKNISREQLNITADELMERFKRGDESRNTEGSGLGLAIAKDLTRLMNGIFELTVDGDLFKVCVMMEKGK